MHQQDMIFAFLCIAPAFVALTAIVFIPILKAIWMSLFAYKLTTTAMPKWNNLKNYIALFQDGEIYEYLKNTFVYVGLTVIVQLFIGMTVALLLNSIVRGRNIFRGLFLVPWTIPSVVTALLWSWLFQPQYGVLNYAFYSLNLQPEMNRLWTQDPHLAMVSVVVAAVWRQTPYMTLMLMAGLLSVPADIVEASRIDGANFFQTFIHVVLPSIRPVIDTSVVIAVINNAQMFTIIYNMTGGGPMNNTTTLSIAAYKKAFVAYDFGSGSALGVIWLIILGVSVFLYKRYADKKTSTYM